MQLIMSWRMLEIDASTKIFKPIFMYNRSIIVLTIAMINNILYNSFIDPYH